MNFKNSVLFLLFGILCTYTSISQNRVQLLDSTYEYLGNTYYKYKKTDSLKAIVFAEAYLQKAKKEKDTVHIIDGHYYLSNLLKKDSIYINYLDTLIAKTKKKPSKIFPAYVYIEKGWFYFHRNENNKALQNYLSAIKYTAIKKNDSLKYTAKLAIASLKVQNKKYRQALNLYNEIYLYIFKKNSKISLYTKMSFLANTSTCYIKIREYDSAIVYNHKLLELGNLYNDSLITNIAYRQRGSIEFENKNYQKSIDYLKKSLPALIQDEQYGLVLSSYNRIAKSYIKLDNTTQALHYYLLVDSLYQKTTIAHSSQKSSYRFLIEYYKEKKRGTKAIALLKQTDTGR